jgi:hypothetical protein
MSQDTRSRIPATSRRQSPNVVRNARQRRAAASRPRTITQANLANRELRGILNDQRIRNGESPLSSVGEEVLPPSPAESNSSNDQSQPSHHDQDDDEFSGETYTESHNLQGRYYSSAHSKRSTYHGIIRLLTGLLTGIAALLDPPTQEDQRRYIDDFESAAGYTPGDPGFVKYKVFHVLFKRGLGSTTARSKHDEIMRRPHVKLLWAAAETQQRYYMADLTTDSTRLEVIQPGDYATHFWLTYRAEFLGRDMNPWHTTHHNRFNRKGYGQGTDSVSKYYEKQFMSMAEGERSSSDWPVDNTTWNAVSQLFNAHVFFSNLEPHLQAKLLQDHPQVCNPANMHQWDLQAIYRAARAVEQSALFCAEKRQRDEQASMKRAIAVNAVAAPLGTINESGGQDEASSDNVPIDRTNLRGEGYRRRTGASQMTKEDWQVFDEMRRLAQGQPTVAGWHGITYSNKEGERVTERKEGFRMDFCKSWRTGKGCGKAGHQVSACKELYPTGAQTYQPKTAPTQSAAQATTLAITNGPTDTNTNDNIFADAQRVLAADLIQGLSAIGYEIGGKAEGVLSKLSSKYNSQ